MEELQKFVEMEFLKSMTLEEINDVLRNLNQKNRELKAENDELRHQRDDLRRQRDGKGKALNDLCGRFDALQAKLSDFENLIDLEMGEAIDKLIELTNQEPSHSLAWRDANTAREAIISAKKNFVLGFTSKSDDFKEGVDFCLEQYDEHLESYAEHYAQEMMEGK